MPREGEPIAGTPDDIEVSPPETHADAAGDSLEGHDHRLVEALQSEEALRGLNFADLKRLHEATARLAATTFIEVENGFRSVNGDGIFIRKQGDVYRLAGFIPLPSFSLWLSSHPNSVLVRGSVNKDEMLRATREMIEELGNRIIE